MKKKSQAKRIVLTASQLGLLLALFIVIGFVIPIYVAPSVASFLGVTTPYEAAREAMSVRLADRNVNSGDSFTVAVSDPASNVRVKSLSYSCDYPDITLAYVDGDTAKRIPCDTALSLPNKNQHRVTVFSESASVSYIPVELMLENEDRAGQISVVVAAAQAGIADKSSLPESTTATLQSFPSQE